MKRNIKGFVAFIMAIAMIVSIAPYAKGSISISRWESLPYADKFMKVVINSEETLEEKLERAYDETGEKLLAPNDIEAHYYPKAGDSMDNYSQYAPKHYIIDSWTIWECNELGGISDGMTKIEVGADYVVSEEHIKQYGQEIGSYIYQPYIEANIIPKEYSFAVLDSAGSPIRDDSFNIKNYKEKTLDIPEGYTGYMMEVRIEGDTSHITKEVFVKSYEDMFNEVDYFVENYATSDVSISYIIQCKTVPYFIQTSLGNVTRIWLKPGENLGNNEEVMINYPHYSPEGEWEVWFIDESGKLYEYKDNDKLVTITEAFTADEYIECLNYRRNNVQYNGDYLYPILKGKLKPIIYKVPVYDMKGKKTNETFDIDVESYLTWDDNIGENSNDIKTYDFSKHTDVQGDVWKLEYNGFTYDVENPTDVWEILFAESTTCDLSKAKLKALCTEHKYDAGVIIVDSTLSKLGTTKYTCTKCGESYTEDDVPKKIAIRTLTLSKDIYTYTGANIKPTLTVKARVNGVTTQLNPKTDYTVTCKNAKNPGVATVVVTGKGKFAGTLTTTFTIKPNWVKNVKQMVEHTYTKNLRITWDKVAGISGYEVYMSDAKDGEFVKVGNVAASSNQYISKNLKPGTRYYYKVRAYKTVGDNKIYGNFSSVTMAVTRTLTTEGVRYDAKNSKLAWWVTKGSSGYEVYCTTNSKFLGSKLGETTYADRSLDVSSLKKGQTYYIRVRSYVKTATGQKIYGAFSSQFKLKR